MKRRGFLKTLCGIVTAAFVVRQLPQPSANLYGSRKIDVPFRPDWKHVVAQDFGFPESRIIMYSVPFTQDSIMARITRGELVGK